MAVAELAGDRLDDREREQIRGDEPADRADGGVEVVDDVGQRHRDHRRVERRQQGAERNGDQPRALDAGTRAHASIMRMRPVVPSTSTSCPSWRTEVARFAPTTAGIEYS